MLELHHCARLALSVAAVNEPAVAVACCDNTLRVVTTTTAHAVTAVQSGAARLALSSSCAKRPSTAAKWRQEEER